MTWSCVLIYFWKKLSTINVTSLFRNLLVGVSVLVGVTVGVSVLVGVFVGVMVGVVVGVEVMVVVGVGVTKSNSAYSHPWLSSSL